MAYVNYNDYELIYLIREGSEQALQMFYNKYLTFIWKTSLRYYKYSDKVNDLVSVGLSTLFKALDKYDPDYGSSFFVFFMVCLNRDILKELRSDYYQVVRYLNEEEVDYNPCYKERYSVTNYAKSVCRDDLDYQIYEDCVIGTMSMKRFSEINGVEFNKVRYRRRCIFKDLKKLLTNEGF